MSEYIPKYPSEEGDDSNKTSSELLAETLKPIYVPQELMLAWESHLASYSRDTHELLDQVKDSEDALNAKYQALLARVQKYEQMLQDITMDSNEFTMDSDVENFTGWNILAQASYWDYLLRKEITKLRDQIKSAEYKGELVTDVSNSVLESLATGNQHISNIIGALTDSPLIRDLDAALSGTSTGLSELRRQHEALKAKQYADALALAAQNGETFDQLTLTFNNLISEQIDRIADEAATRTRVFEELEDGLTVESQLRQEGQEVIATQVSTLKASTETSLAGIRKEYITIAGAEEAITSALSTYTAEVDGTIATILTDYVAYANLDYALTSKSDKLLAIVNDNMGKLNITNEIQAGLTSIKALSTVTVDLNGVVSGYGLISELENGIVKSAFGVNADTFYIGKPTDKVKPFVVTSKPTNIDGINFPAGTWINSAIIANATIGSAHIKDASITNAKIKELDASKITTGTLDAKRIRIGDATHFDSGFAPTDVLDNAKSYVDRTTGNLVNNPSVSENTVRWSTGIVTDQPFLGTTIPALTLTTSGDLMTISDKIDVDPAKAYEVSVWVKKSAAVGSTYLGLTLGNALGEAIQVNAVTQSGGSSLTNNFYHWNVAAAATPTDWKKLVAYVMPAGTNPSDMQSVGTVTYNAIMPANTRKLQMRLLNYYNRGTTTSVWFANPKIVEVDPNVVIAAAKAQIEANSKTKTFTSQPTTPYSSGDIYRNGSSIYVSTVSRASGSYSSSDWVLVGDVTAFNTAADSIKLGGTAAATIINNASKGLAVYNDVMSDLKVTPVEKTALNTEWIRVQAEYSNMLTHATVLGVSTTAFTSAYTALSTISPSMSSILSSMTTTTTLSAAQRDALRTQFTNYYAQVTALNTAINDKIAANAKAQADAKSITFTAQPTIPYSKGDLWKDGSTIKVTTVTRTSGSYTAADWILVGDVTSQNTAADTAKVNGVSAATVASNADKGAAVYSDVMSDLKITPVEKTAINQEWNRIQKEYASLLAQAQALSVTTTAYTAAYTGLSTTDPAMSTILAAMSTTTTLTAAQRDAYKTQYTAYYTQAVAITKAINDKIAANAKAQADAKSKTFTAQPAPPYTAGDLWKDGSTIRVCMVTRASGSYVAADWILVGDVTSANTAANSNQLGGKSASTVLGDITAAKNSANAATSQLTLWKYPNSTFIDGGKIYTNTITANHINVDNLSLISGNLGTIKVGTANIDELAVTTFNIQDRAVTSSLTQTFAFSWSVNTDYAAWQYPTVSKSVNLNGFETSIVGSRCLLFVQTDLLAEARNDSSGDRVSSTGIYAEILLGTTVIATIPSLRSYGGLLTKYVNVEGGNGFYNIVGSYTNRAVISYGAFMAPFTMTDALKQPSVPLTIRIVTSATNNYGMNLYVSATNLTAYLVEFKK